MLIIGYLNFFTRYFFQTDKTTPMIIFWTDFLSYWNTVYLTAPLFGMFSSASVNVPVVRLTRRTLFSVDMNTKRLIKSIMTIVYCHMSAIFMTLG